MNTLKSLELTPKEIVERNSAGLPVYPIIVKYSESRVLDWMTESKWLPSGSIRKNSLLICKGSPNENSDYDKLRTIIRGSKSVSQFESSLKEFWAKRPWCPTIYFLRTNILENGFPMTSPVCFVLSDGTTTITQRGTESFGTYTYNNYIVDNTSLLTLNFKKGTLAYVYEGVLFEYKNLEELSKVSKITISPLRE